MYVTQYQSPMGTLSLTCDGEKLTGLWIAGQKYFGGTVGEELIEKDDFPVFDLAKRWLDAYFAGERPMIADLPLSPKGSEFRTIVWELLCKIPYGEVVTYGDIAKLVAARMKKENMSAQAVGGAVGHNPISIIIPCHRVVGANGNLTGYAGGIERKIALLKHEGVDMSHMFTPTRGTAL